MCFVLVSVHQVHCAIIKLDRVKKLLVDTDLHQYCTPDHLQRYVAPSLL
jgi:hypothetical protein